MNTAGTALASNMRRGGECRRRCVSIGGTVVQWCRVAPAHDAGLVRVRCRCCAIAHKELSTEQCCAKENVNFLDVGDATRASRCDARDRCSDPPVSSGKLLVGFEVSV